MATTVETHKLGKTSLEYRSIGDHQIKVFLSKVRGLTTEARDKLLKTAEQTKGVLECRLTNDNDLICLIEPTGTGNSFHEIKTKLLNRLVNKVERINKLSRRAQLPQGNPKRRGTNRFRKIPRRKAAATT